LSGSGLLGVGATIALSAVCVLAGCDRPRDSSTPAPQPVTPSTIQVPVPATAPSPADGSPAKPNETARDLGRQEADAKGTMTKEEESKAMPMAGQANNYSSSADKTSTTPASSK
jgi:hypothetical protein